MWVSPYVMCLYVISYLYTVSEKNECEKHSVHKEHRIFIIYIIFAKIGMIIMCLSNAI